MSNMNNRGRHRPTGDGLRTKEDVFERLLVAVYGDDITRDELMSYHKKHAERIQARKLDAIRSACEKIQETGRPICLRDMQAAIENAIMKAVKAYTDADTQENAVQLLALLLCRKAVYDGAAFEGDDG